MAICQFFLRGQCKFGNQCRNEHPAQRPSGFGSSWNGTSSNNSSGKNVAFTVETITRDLTAGHDKPLWPLSSYGASKYEPCVITNLDESAEELRVKAMQALQANNLVEYQKYEMEKITATEQILSSALSNASQVYQKAYDLNGGGTNSTNPGSAFQGTNAAASGSPSAFAKPASGFGAFSGGNSAFGKSAFGQPAFGQSAFGTIQSTSAFPTTTPTTSTFGQTSTPSAFGQPQTTSAFGQTSQPQSVFGKPSNAFASSSSGQGFSAFSNSSTNSGGFATFAGPGNSAFGSNANTNSVFGKPAFGADNNTSGSVFGDATKNPSVFSSTPSTGSAFAPANNSSVFGVPASNQTTSAFAPATNAFSASTTSNTSSPFGQASGNSAFGSSQPTSAFGTPKPAAFSAFGSAPSAFTSSNNQQLSGTIDFAKAMAVVKPVAGKDKYDAMLPADYTQMLPAAAREAFEAPKFEWGKIPDFIPPVQFR